MISRKVDLDSNENQAFLFVIIFWICRFNDLTTQNSLKLLSYKFAMMISGLPKGNSCSEESKKKKFDSHYDCKLFKKRLVNT